MIPSLGNAQLGDMDTQVVRRWLSSLSKAGLSRSTVAKAHRVLRQLLQHAVDAGYLAKNPCTVRGAASEPQVAMRCPTMGEVLAIAEAIEPQYRALVLLSGFGGLRWGECAGLRRSKVDLLHRTVSIAEQATEVAGRIEVGPPKTAAGVRVVALPSLVVQALEEHLARFAAADADGLVFPAPDGGYMRGSNFSTRHWKRAVVNASVEPLRFHDLRHGAATLAATTGATTKELMSRLGHASPAAALRYQHVVSGRDAAIADAIDDVVRRSNDPNVAPALPIRRI